MPADSKLLTEIIEYMPVAVFAKNADDDFRFVLWNKQMEKMSGISQVDALGRDDFEVFGDGKEALSYREMDITVMDGGVVTEIVEEEVVTPSGTIICHTLKVPLTL